MWRAKQIIEVYEYDKKGRLRCHRKEMHGVEFWGHPPNERRGGLSRELIVACASEFICDAIRKLGIFMIPFLLALIAGLN